MNIKSYLIVLIVITFLVSCGDDVLPKPKAMLRLEYPESPIENLVTEKFEFEHNSQAIIKKNKNFLGINKFKSLSKLTNKKIVILGGISKKNKKKLRLLKMNEFAGISYFEQ